MYGRKFPLSGEEVWEMPIPRSVFGALVATLLFTMLLGGVAEAGVTWCVRDPIFDIDGRIVRVQELVPVENANRPVDFVLRVAPGSAVSWHVPEGEIFVGSVTIVTDRSVSRDTPRLFVSAAGPRFPMKLIVSGSGLRVPTYEVLGTSRGISVALRLVTLPRSDGDDGDD